MKRILFWVGVVVLAFAIAAWVVYGQEPMHVQSVHWTGSERRVDIGHHSYVVDYDIEFSGLVFVPSTNPPGQPHYPAKVKVFEISGGKRTLIGKEFDAQWTERGCFEDDPHFMVEEALKLALGKKDYCESRDNANSTWDSCMTKWQNEFAWSHTMNPWGGQSDPSYQSLQIGGCDESLWSHVYHPDRLTVHNRCATVIGTIVDATHGRRKDGVRKEADGDCHGWLKLDSGEEQFLNSGNNSNEDGNLVFEVVCMFPVTQADAKQACANYKNKVKLAPVGSHVRISGSWVMDDNHAHWNEIHPVSSIEVIP